MPFAELIASFFAVFIVLCTVLIIALSVILLSADVNLLFIVEKDVATFFNIVGASYKYA